MADGKAVTFGGSFRLGGAKQTVGHRPHGCNVRGAPGRPERAMVSVFLDRRDREGPIERTMHGEMTGEAGRSCAAARDFGRLEGACEPLLGAVRPDRRGLVSYLISLLCHALLIIAVVAFPKIEPANPPAEESLAVDIVTEEEFVKLTESSDKAQAPKGAIPSPKERDDANAAPATTAPDAHDRAPVAPAPAAPAPVEGDGRWRRASRILSQAALADPANRKMAETLPRLELFTRLEQLCDFEAVLQIRQSAAQFRPEFVVAYAMRKTRTVDGVLVADGAAFRSDRRWYNLAFRCRISPLRPRVEAFDFVIGATIPKRDWASHDLPDALTEIGGE
jgi:hypothetical protein